MTIPFVDLKAQYALLEEDIKERIHTVLEHGKFILGPEVKELEERLAAFSTVRHTVACSSGTDALLLALLAYDVGPGDAVFTTPFTFIATAEVISLLGATPVFVDIDPATFNIDPIKLQQAVQAMQTKDPSLYPLPKGAEKLTPRGIIPVDLFGLPADYDSIASIASTHKLFVVQDACQSYGASYKGKPTGSQADIAATSFFPAKPLGCYGDGGAAFTDDDALAEKMHSLKVHGMGTHRYSNVRVGLNARLDTLQAAILLSKLTVFAQEIQQRNEAATRYTHMLSDSPVQLPAVPQGSTSAWAQYSILTDNRDKLAAALKEQGIPVAIYYPVPLHRQQAFAFLGYEEGDMPVCQESSAKILSLPMHPYLTESLQEKICTLVKENL